MVSCYLYSRALILSVCLPSFIFSSLSLASPPSIFRCLAFMYAAVVVVMVYVSRSLEDVLVLSVFFASYWTRRGSRTVSFCLPSFSTCFHGLEHIHLV